MSKLGDDIEAALALHATGAPASSIARTLSRSEAWVELQIELAAEQAAREADAEQRAKVRAAAKAEAFKAAQKKGGETRAARLKAGGEKTSSIAAADYSAGGVVERTFRTSNGHGAAIRLGDELGRLICVETFGVRLDVGQRVAPQRCVWTWYVAP